MRESFLPNFSSQAIIDVFLFFLFRPQEEAYLGKIVRATNKALIQVQRTLKQLLKTGLISKSTHGKKLYYKADPKHIAFADLKNLALKAKVWSPLFKKDLERFKNKVDFGFIYGSVAKGTHSSESDLDIFLIGDLTLHDAASFMTHLSRELMREVNVVVYTPKELLSEINKMNPFVINVLKEQKVWLFGNNHDFEKLFRERFDRKASTD